MNDNEYSLVKVTPNHYLHADGTNVVKQDNESTTNVILSRNRLQLTPANSVILRREQLVTDSIRAKQDKLDNIQRAQQDAIIYQRIDADERLAYKDLRYPDEIPLTTIAVTTSIIDDATREHYYHHN